MLKKWTLIFGIVLVVVGILGFVQGDMVLGMFHVDGMHNTIHLLTGIIALIAWKKGEMIQRRFFQVFGWVYLVVTILGFVQGDTVLGLFGVNMADNILHLAIAALALWLGYSGRKPSMMSSPQM